MFRQQSEPRARRAHPGQRQRRARACGGRSGRGGGSCRWDSGRWQLPRGVVGAARGTASFGSAAERSVGHLFRWRRRREPACNSRRKCEVQKESGECECHRVDPGPGRVTGGREGNWTGPGEGQVSAREQAETVEAFGGRPHRAAGAEGGESIPCSAHHCPGLSLRMHGGGPSVPV